MSHEMSYTTIFAILNFISPDILDNQNLCSQRFPYQGVIQQFIIFSGWKEKEPKAPRMIKINKFIRFGFASTETNEEKITFLSLTFDFALFSVFVVVLSPPRATMNE